MRSLESHFQKLNLPETANHQLLTTNFLFLLQKKDAEFLAFLRQKSLDPDCQILVIVRSPGKADVYLK